MRLDSPMSMFLGSVAVVPLPCRGMPWPRINNPQLQRMSWVCAFCLEKVASDTGIRNSSDGTSVMFCPCGAPTYFDGKGDPHPKAMPGSSLVHLPPEIDALYGEVRRSIQARAYMGAMMLCRTLLAHVAHQLGSGHKKNFLAYVEWLDANHYIPPNGKGWVDYIRDRGNEANHEIALRSEDDALGVLAFAEGLLHIVYELPGKLPKP